MSRASNGLLVNVALGAAAGLAGTLALNAARSRSQRVLPEGAAPPIRENPGDFMVHRAQAALPMAVRRRIPEPVEHGASTALAMGYGAAFGALYALLRPRGGPVLRDGVVLGLGTWAAGYLGWLPASGLMPPVWKQEPMQTLVPPAQHAVYGIATVAAYDTLHGLGDLGSSVAGAISAACSEPEAPANRG